MLPSLNPFDYFDSLSSSIEQSAIVATFVAAVGGVLSTTT
jgi:hypothetical protein